MRTVYAHFRRKEPVVDVEPCVVEKVVELSATQYSSFCRGLTEDYDFIRECAGNLYQDGNSINHCLLVLGVGSNDGVLVRSEGSNWARYHAYLPNARLFVVMDQHPSLDQLNRDAVALVEKYVKLAVDCQLDGRYKLSMDDIRNDSQNHYMQDSLIAEMLSEREEIDVVEGSDNELYLYIAPEYRVQEDTEDMRKLSETDVEIMCAKHVLWLNGVGGEAANFSRCRLENLDLSGRNLAQACFEGARLVNCNFYRTVLENASFRGAGIHDCEMTDMKADGASFANAKIRSTCMSRCDLNRANFSHATFADSDISSSHMDDCCFEGADLGEIRLDSAYVDRPSFDEQDWLDDAPIPGMGLL